MDDVRHELIEIIGSEFNEAGIGNTVVGPRPIAGGGEIPAQMLVPFGAEASPSDGDQHEPTAHVYFLPELEDPAVLQYMVLLDHPVSADAHGDLARFVNALNANLTITGYEFSEQLGRIMFRHSHPIATAPLDPGVIAWTLTMVRDTVVSFAPLVADVAAGGDYDAAIARLDATLQDTEPEPVDATN